ncbi:MAG: VacJ family lipoprotein [Alphaproteobacteria bacterium]|nr:VacJ family lipoprotein [Alphaproteobacteria bacterium]
MRAIAKAFGAGAALLLAGCATAPDPSGANDPYESFNRDMFNFNRRVDRAVIKPVAEAYVDAVPDVARDSVHNFFVNLDLPITFANDVLQGEVERSGETALRFTLNSTLGVGGLFDVATTNFKLPFHTEDFGQTLAVWGVEEGPYLVFPIVGPNPPRDAVGHVVDIAFDPMTYIDIREQFLWSAGRSVLEGVDLRARNLETLESIERQSIDFYASVRSLYRQNRNNEIRNGQPDVTNLPNL